LEVFFSKVIPYLEEVEHI